MDSRNTSENIMNKILDNIRGIADANTAIGEPIIVDNNLRIIPVSKVSYGIISGGGEYQDIRNFAGANGAGVSIEPIGFLCVTDRVEFILCESGSGEWASVINQVVAVCKKYIEKQN